MCDIREPVFPSVLVCDADARCARCDEPAAGGVLHRCGHCWMAMCGHCHARHVIDRATKRADGERTFCDTVVETATLAAVFNLDQALLDHGLWGLFPGFKAPMHPAPSADDFRIAHKLCAPGLRALFREGRFV